MNNVTVYENSIGQPMVLINNGDSITCMSESDYNEMIATQALHLPTE
jgi:PHD/YefM family antitoxin component YafN of YafNO toxin-antitoxin module